MWRIPSPLLSASSASHHFSLSRRFGVAWRGVAWRGVAWRGVASSRWRGVALRGVHFSDLSLSRARAGGAPFHIGVLLFSALDSLGLHTSLLLASRLLLLFNRSATLLTTVCAMCCSMADEASSSLPARRGKSGEEELSVRPFCCLYEGTAPSQCRTESAEAGKLPADHRRRCWKQRLDSGLRLSAVEVRAANSVELAQSDARLAKHQLELVERERDRLRTEATTAKAELSVDRSDRERAKAELA